MGGATFAQRCAHLFDPATWPSYFSRCQGTDIWDLEGRRYTDFNGGVGAILLGHADPEVNAAVHRRVSLGSYSTLASPDEVTLAEKLLALHPRAGKVRYARGGGEALGLAVRIARAATGRSGDW
jgi:glutamate-1-semialdehyde 2,1-aminomutase